VHDLTRQSHGHSHSGSVHQPFPYRSKCTTITTVLGVVVVAVVFVVVVCCSMCMILQGRGHGHSHSSSPQRSFPPRRTAGSDENNVVGFHCMDMNDQPHSSNNEVLPVTTTRVTSADDQSGNINVKAAFIHVIGDLLQSFGVLIAAYIIFYKVHCNL